MMALEDYNSGHRQSSRLCQVCGEPTDGRVQIELKGKADRVRTYYPTIASLSRGFCERHAIEVFEQGRAIILGNEEAP